MTPRRPAAAVELVALEKRFGSVRAVGPLDLRIEPGELMVLLGPSGCGKSTLLRMVAGIEQPSAGEVRIGEQSVSDLEPGERDVAMVFQNYALYPHMTVRENLGFSMRVRRTPRSEMETRVQAAAERLELQDLLERRPGELSGGQRQRVALGRALLREPSVFLFDEPLSNLDARLRAEMRALIAELHRSLGTTMIFVTHDQVEALSLGSRVAVLRDGRLHQVAEPLTVYRRPADQFVARFVGMPSVNELPGQTLQDSDGLCWFEGGRLSLALGRVPSVPSGPVVLGARPEAVRLLDPGDADVLFTSAVRRVEPLGSELLVHVDGPAEQPWIARVAPTVAARPGDAVGVGLHGPDVLIFDRVSARRVLPLDGH